jgi:hypothetical protein
MSCCDNPTVTLTVNIDHLIVGDHVQTTEVYVKGGIVIKRGDLLKITPATNEADLATAADDWDVIAVHSMDATQTTYHNTNSLMIGAYNQGEYNEEEIKIAGVVLVPADILKAKGHANKGKNIEIRKLAGV